MLCIVQHTADDLDYIEEDSVLAEHVGQPAPVLTLKSMAGKSIDLADGGRFFPSASIQ